MDEVQQGGRNGLDERGQDPKPCPPKAAEEGLLDELARITDERDHYRTALERISNCPARRFPAEGLWASYLQNTAIEALDGAHGHSAIAVPAQRKAWILHRQVCLKKEPGDTIKLADITLRIGDLVAMMICAEYMKKIENYTIAFQLIDPIHKSLKADVLFKNTIDEFAFDEKLDGAFGKPRFPEIYDPGPLWIASTFYYQRYGAEVIPRLNLDAHAYGGPELDWGRYLVFHPLFDPPYNTLRGMEPSFVEALCDDLHGALGERALVITDQPERIHSKIRKIHTNNLYDLAYIIGKSKIYIGGDTGFTHLAAAGRVEHLFAIYGNNFMEPFPVNFANICFDELLYAFASWGKYWGTDMDVRPKWDPTVTDLHFHLLENNGLPVATRESIVQESKNLLDGPSSQALSGKR